MDTNWDSDERALPAAPVLAVDDAPANLLALSALLEPLRVELVTASSGAEALERLREGEFALVLLDVQMPQLDGFAVLKALRARDTETPVILLTAFEATAEMTRRAYASGVFDFLTKPIDVDALRGKVSSFVALYNRGRALRLQADALHAKDRFLGVLAHDLRTPISIVSLAGRLLETDPREETRKIAARVLRAAGRMEHLTRDLLDYARAAAHRMPMRARELDLSKLCRDVVEDFSSSNTAVRFSVETPSALVGAWDEDRLHQALANLITNAVKYGDGRVELRLRQLHDRAVISVSNGGTPIAPERLAQIFEPFEQGDPSNPGIGLGLFIVREIARAHGGGVIATSLGDQTTFELALPMPAAQIRAPASRELETKAQQA